MNLKALTVSQLNMYTRSLIESDVNLRSITVKGEISNFTRHLKSGHVYFTLKDSNAAVKTVMFKSNADRLSFFLEDGISVFVKGRVSLFERDGTYQLYAEDIVPDGVGAYHAAFNKLKEKLEKLGLFDPQYKKPIPQFPERIGIVTSPTGAAFFDVISILERRFPLAVPVLFPCSVQGTGAAETVVEAINHFNETKDVDVIIVTRGGGSYEDLIEFNSEKLAWTVFESDLPIISAVGHEIDYTIIDFVADLRAPTPSAAAELVVPHKDSILEELELQRQSMAKAIQAHILRYERLVEMYRSGMNIDLVLSSKESRLNNAKKMLAAHILRISDSKEYELLNEMEKLNALNPLAVLMRGFALPTKDGKTIKSVNDVNIEDNFEMKMKDGVIKGAAKEIIKN